MSKEEKYKTCIKQIKAVCEGEKNLIANLSNIGAILSEAFHWWWTGFYLVEKEQLVLGPFQGPVACTRINYGKGVCGTSWKEEKTILVDNVHDFPGHIACSEKSLSEIVVPIFKDRKVQMVLDVDSEKEAHFDNTDQIYLEEIGAFISNLL